MWGGLNNQCTLGGLNPDCGRGCDRQRLCLQAAQLRQGWRVKHGAIQLSMPECDMRIIQPNSLVPDISMRFSDGGEDSPAQTLVSELMIMANEAIGLLGEPLPLPRGSGRA